LIGENSIVLRNFELGEKVPHPDATNLPLGLAVALLKDSSGKIDIDLAVSGNVDDPEFSYGSVILDSLGTFLAKIVVSPFAALGGMLGVEASDLEYVKFLEGRSDLTPPEKEKAGKLAEALSMRPELQLVIAGVFDPEADELALRTARLDNMLDLKISEIASDSGAETQYADMRREALEQLFREQLAEDNPDQKLDALQEQFSTTTKVEGQKGATTTMDSLAYANALRQQLIGVQEVGEEELAGLASSRARALQTAMLAADESLQQRISIVDSVEVERAQGEPIRMKVTLAAEAE
jgi:hypothetical protein